MAYTVRQVAVFEAHGMILTGPALEPAHAANST
jgi:hypothetical protein